MTNKRDLKRKINYACGDLFAECVATSLYAGNPKQEDVDAILQLIIRVNNDFVCRISHPEPGIPARTYYKSVEADFDKSVAEIADQISNLG